MVKKSLLFVWLFATVTISLPLDAAAQAQSTRPLLFDAYPALEGCIPYVALGNLQETPIQKINFLSELYGVNFYIKDDGFPGKDRNGGEIFSGNKRRKLEFLLAHAIKCGKKRVYTMGGAGSNHAVATAAYAHELGLDCTLVLGPQRNTRYVQRNLKLDLFYGAKIVAVKNRSDRNPTCKGLVQSDSEGYFIPLGGSNEVGAIGFVNAAFELKKQIDQGVMPKPDIIYITVSSTGTAAGLIVGLQAAGLGDIVVRPVRIDDDPDELAQDLANLIEKTSRYLRNFDQNVPLVQISPKGLNIINNFAGDECVRRDHKKISRHAEMNFDSYALITPEESIAIQLLYNNGGIKLDGTYTGKTFSACLYDMSKSLCNSNKTILFWDSFCDGGFEEYTNSVDTTKLPNELQNYINEVYPIQDLDQGV
jgi:D-cysteine desulfhydrase